MVKNRVCSVFHFFFLHSLFPFKKESKFFPFASIFRIQFYLHSLCKIQMPSVSISLAESEYSAAVPLLRRITERRRWRIIHLAKRRCNWRNIQISDGVIVVVEIECSRMVHGTEFRHWVKPGQTRPIGMYRVRRNFKVESIHNVVLL